MRKNLRWLYTFCTVAKVLNYKRAAEELFLTPSAISHQISELELQLGAKLFYRTTPHYNLKSEIKFGCVIQGVILAECEL